MLTKSKITFPCYFPIPFQVLFLFVLFPIIFIFLLSMSLVRSVLLSTYRELDDLTKDTFKDYQILDLSTTFPSLLITPSSQILLQTDLIYSRYSQLVLLYLYSIVFLFESVLFLDNRFQVHFLHYRRIPFLLEIIQY